MRDYMQFFKGYSDAKNKGQKERNIAPEDVLFVFKEKAAEEISFFDILDKTKKDSSEVKDMLSIMESNGMVTTEKKEGITTKIKLSQLGKKLIED